tara:strand:+ start:4184 stop:4357 length:174 start_codon:yes stop_codon:yes gene_type:complete
MAKVIRRFGGVDYISRFNTSDSEEAKSVASKIRRSRRSVRIVSVGGNHHVLVGPFKA